MVKLPSVAEPNEIVLPVVEELALLAAVKAALAVFKATVIELFCVKSVAADKVDAKLAAKNAAVIELFCVSSVAVDSVTAALAAKKAAVILLF